MASPAYNHQEEKEYLNDLDDWTVICQYCIKPISATRPPIYNEANCSCSQIGNHAAGINLAIQPKIQRLEREITACDQPVYTYQDSIPRYGPSGTQDLTTNHAPLVHETRNNFQDLNINWNNNKVTQDHPYSIQNYSWPLRSWLTENESSYTLSSIPQNSFYAHKSSSTKAKKGSKRGNSSLCSSGSSVEPGLKGWGPDPFTETGAWACEIQQEIDGHPMAMSGMSDSYGK
ncbi:4050430d-a0ed-4578-a6ba-ef1155b55608-CDS [Sclerotinia trifoliorum]|uniref:4050430d-a0ed-4578-a6ba-ef1155b55608-CDS n=1 Tax=Sclerotinia trifoliorum TaxID=28548 RepID=A0A8H2ZS81_9HELO|nr:4050430d-a0ed-4578-a6ba-ef1155b55608-CDS [Sclerotinia trifoliorum]